MIKRKSARHKNRKAVFVCQVTEGYIKVIKCFPHNSKREFSGIEKEALPLETDDKKIAQKFKESFDKLEYSNNPLIVSLPRSSATIRRIRIPAQDSREIRKIVSLQASRYLPYPANELITGYQVISTDKEGYAEVNLVIVHKDVIERYLKILKELNIKEVSINLSSFGICNLYGHIKQGAASTAMVVDIDSESIELAVASQKKLLFSRYFRLDRRKDGWEDLFIEEIKKTGDVYAKEELQEPPRKIVILGRPESADEFARLLNKEPGFSVEVVPYYEKINLKENLLNKLSDSDTSFASLFGLGIEKIEDSLNLLPQDTKDKLNTLSRRREHLRLGLLVSGIILAFLLGINKNLDNKAGYSREIKRELNKISAEASLLEQKEKRLKALSSRSQKNVTVLDALYELYQIIPGEIQLVNFTYEQDSQLILHGEAPELNSVFEFVSGLEGSSTFNKFNIKVRYASKKKRQKGEIVDFEIICLRK